MGVIIDTSVVIEAERGRLDFQRYTRGRESEAFGLSVVTATELIHGIERADTEVRRMKRSAFVEKVLETFPLYPVDLAVARVYARIWARLSHQGIPIGAHDMLIGATAISRGDSVVTFNPRHFSRIEGLKIELLD